MRYSNVTDLVWADDTQTSINCIVDFIETGPIPFTASLYDKELHGLNIYNECLSGKYGSISASVINITPPHKVVTMRQARLALLEQGLLSDVDVAINSLSEPQRSQVQIEWEYSQTVERDRPFVSLLGTALGLTDTGLDELFTLAETL